MDNDKFLSKQEVVKIIKHDFDCWLGSRDPAFSRYKQLYCVLSSGIFLSVVAVTSQEDKLILSFDREESVDVMPLKRVQQAVDNKWQELQHIERTNYEKLLYEIDGQKL
jgi:hypothetical protein